MRAVFVLIALSLLAAPALAQAADPICGSYRDAWNKVKDTRDLDAMEQRIAAMGERCPALRKEAQNWVRTVSDDIARMEEARSAAAAAEQNASAAKQDAATERQRANAAKQE